jgi:hypothetical protein
MKSKAVGWVLIILSLNLLVAMSYIVHGPQAAVTFASLIAIFSLFVLGMYLTTGKK